MAYAKSLTGKCSHPSCMKAAVLAVFSHKNQLRGNYCLDHASAALTQWNIQEEEDK